MPKHVKGHKSPPPRRAGDTAGVKSHPAYFIVFVVALVAFSVLAILLCSGIWTPWS